MEQVAKASQTHEPPAVQGSPSRQHPPEHVQATAGSVQRRRHDAAGRLFPQPAHKVLAGGQGARCKTEQVEEGSEQASGRESGG